MADEKEVEPTGDIDLKPWEDLLDSLIPDRILELHDTTGAVHRVNTAVPAKIQLQLAKILGELYRLPSGAGEAFAKAIKAAKDADSKAAGFMIALNAVLQDESTSEQVQKLLGEAFVLAHPLTCRKAIENVYADPESTARAPKDQADATIMDAMAIEDVVQALLPFGARLVRRLLPAMRQMMALNGAQAS